MPALSQDRELDQLLAGARPEVRYREIAIHFRRLTIESPIPIPDDSFVTARDGTKLRVRTLGSQIICCGDPAGSSTHLQDEEPVVWEGGSAIFRTEVLARFGGLWDSLEQRYVGEAQTPLLLDVLESQVEIVRAFAARWATFKTGVRHPKHTYMAVDDRGGGKTWLVLLPLAAALEFPRHPDGAEFVLWIVSVNHTARTEIDREIKRWLPADWYEYRGQPPKLHLVSGTVVSLPSADDPEALRAGRVDLFYLNEGAKLDSRSYRNALGRVKDRKGFAVISSNPPTSETLRGTWIQALYERWYEAKESGARNPVEFIRVNSALNPLLDRETNADVREVLRWLSPELDAADGQGLILPVGNYAYRPPFDITKHVRDFDRKEWDSKDITPKLTARLTHQPAEWILGYDFQLHGPGNVAVALKAYGDLDEPTFWIHGDFVCPQGDESDLMAMIEDDLEWLSTQERGTASRFGKANVLGVADPSGSWQDYQHTRGKDSFSLLRSLGWRVVPPIPAKDGKKPRHPPVLLRIARLNKLLADGRLFVVKSKMTERIAESLKKCPLKVSSNRMRGPYPHGDYAHLPDGLGYALWFANPGFGNRGDQRAWISSAGTDWRTRPSPNANWRSRSPGKSVATSPSRWGSSRI